VHNFWFKIQWDLRVCTVRRQETRSINTIKKKYIACIHYTYTLYTIQGVWWEPRWLYVWWLDRIVSFQIKNTVFFKSYTNTIYTYIYTIWHYYSRCSYNGGYDLKKKKLQFVIRPCQYDVQKSNVGKHYRGGLVDIGSTSYILHKHIYLTAVV